MGNPRSWLQEQCMALTGALVVPREERCMKSVRLWASLGSVGLVVVATQLAGSIAVASAAPSASARTQLSGSEAPAAARTAAKGAVASTSSFTFDLVLKLRNATGAQATLRAVSKPGSSRYHHYLTTDQWIAKYSPTKADVAAAKSWLKQQGFSLGAVPKDRLFVAAQGTAAQVEKAFSTSLGYYDVNGKTVRLANSPLSIPASIGGFVSGVTGVNENIATTSLTNGASAPSTSAAEPDQEPPPPAGFRNPQPCSSYWGQKTDSIDNASLYAPFKSPQAYDICGYKPSQLRDGYSISTSKKQNGTGVTIAIVDAYDSPTLLSDAQTYFRLNDPNHQLSSSQFTNIQPPTVDQEDTCGASGWYPEQALDVESSHSMATGANIQFVGAQDCFNTALLAALQTAITNGASVVSDSWGDGAGDLLDDQADKTAFDNTFMLAGTTGVSVLFSSGDSGDEFADTGLDDSGLSGVEPVHHRRRRHHAGDRCRWRAAGRIRMVDGEAADVRRRGDDQLRFGHDPRGTACLAGGRWRRHQLHLHAAVLPGACGARGTRVP